jgi:hypothetical protein
LIHVALKVRNQSAILMRIVSGQVRVTPMLPLAQETLAVLASNEGYLRPGETEIRWPNRKTIEWDWAKEPREIEPLECDTFHFDFVVDDSWRTFQAYSFLRNAAKGGRVIGWNTTTIHDIFSEENHTMPGIETLREPSTAAEAPSVKRPGPEQGPPKPYRPQKPKLPPKP